MKKNGPSFGPSLEELGGRGFLVQDLWAVYRGLRPMCRFGLLRSDPGTWRLFEGFLEEAGLKALRYESSYEGGPPVVSVGRDPARLEAFREATERKEGSRSLGGDLAAVRELGKLLGYPDCCVEAFAEAERPGRPAAGSFPERVRRRSGPGPYPFVLNFLYNFHSRGGEELKTLLAAGYRGMNLYLLPWIPCRFGCAPSLRFGRALFKDLKRAAPGYAEGLRRALQSAVLFLDERRFVPLAGARKVRGGWAYDESLDLGTLAEAGLLERLRAGTRAALKDLPAGATVFDFTGGAS